MTETELLRHAVIDLAARLTTAAMLCNEHTHLESALETIGIDGRAAVTVKSLLADVVDTHGAATTRAWNHADGSPLAEWDETTLENGSRAHVLQLTPRRAIILQDGEHLDPYNASLATTRDGRHVSTVLGDLVPNDGTGDITSARRLALTRLERRARERADEANREHAVLAHALREAEFKERHETSTELES